MDGLRNLLWFACAIVLSGALAAVLIFAIGAGILWLRTDRGEFIITTNGVPIEAVEIIRMGDHIHYKCHDGKTGRVYGTFKIESKGNE